MGIKSRYTILFIIFVLLISQTTAWNIIRQPEVSNISDGELQNFLTLDQTDTKEYTNVFQCGHFSRQLAKNATAYNITLGGAILGHDPSFRGYDNHIVNYVYINGTIQFIEPQNDQLMRLNQSGYEYFKLYKNGKYVPSRW